MPSLCWVKENKNFLVKKLNYNVLLIIIKNKKGKNVTNIYILREVSNILCYLFSLYP